MKRNVLLLSIAAMMIGFIACKPKQAAEPSTQKATTSNDILEDVSTELIGKHWKLTELMGEPVSSIEGGKEAFITFEIEGNRVFGNFGCNSFSGTYTLKPGNRITFSETASTQMMCFNMDIETKMSEVLQRADNYNLNSGKLVLNRAKMAPLARFEAAE